MSAAEILQEGLALMPDYEGAEREAEETLAQFGIEKAPINPIAVANFLGYSVHAAKFRDLSLSGRVLLKDGVIRIDVNAYDPPNRRRFTIAHEIGHALLHTKGYTNFEIPDRVNERNIASREVALERASAHDGPRPVIEAEADRFAAALLMPRKLVREEFTRNKNAASLARTFEVSEAALTIRLTQLGLA